MVIILEGIDKSGKTSIAKELSDRCGFSPIRIFDRNKPKETMIEISNDLYQLSFPINDLYEDLVVAETLNQINIDLNIVLDRSAPSGDIYRKLYGKQTNENLIDWWYKKMKKIGAVYVWVHAPYDIILERVGHKNGDGFNMDLKTFDLLESEFTKHYELAIANEIKSIKIFGTEPVEDNILRIMDRIKR